MTVTMKQWMNIKYIHIVVIKHCKSKGQTHSTDISNRLYKISSEHWMIHQHMEYQKIHRFKEISN